ncbi:MAG TPA: ATP-binding protein [Ktedonobacteraceae bacterium]|jgi:signal transduction histidine kinase
MHVPDAHDDTTKPPDDTSPGAALPTMAAPAADSQDAGHIIAELLIAIEHEFRTPLAVIQGYSSTLLLHEQRLAPEERREFHTAIEQASTKMARLLDQVLELAQLETGAIHIDEGTVDVPQIVRQSIARARRTVPAALREQVTFHMHLRDESKNEVQEAPLVRGDPGCVHKIVAQLLENAIRFSPQGGRIDVIVQPVAPPRLLHAPPPFQQPSTFLELCICDYGIGIPQEHLERIFERFYRVETALTQEIQSLGLGLAVCRHLVALHQGRIWAESCQAGGSAFHVWLPTVLWPPDR